MMAHYYVRQFSSNLLDNGNGYKNIFILCELMNSNGNFKIHQYRIAPDVRYENINFLNEIIEAGFNCAKNTSSKIEIREDKDRFYLWLYLPINGVIEQLQVTGERVRG